MKSIFYFQIFLLVGVYHSIGAQTSTIEIEQEIDSFLNIAAFTDIFVDKSATLDLEEIKEKNISGAFIPLQDLVLEGKYTRSKYNYWLHFSLTNKQSTPFVLSYKCGFHKNIDFYQVSDTGVILHQATGNGRIITQQDRLFSNKYTVRFELDRFSNYDFYIKINNELSFTEPISVLSNEVYELEYNYNELFFYHLFYTFFFVFLLFTSIFTFTQYVLNKERPFLYYTLHTLATFILYYKLFDISNPVIQNLPPWLGAYKYFTFFSFLPPIPTLLFAISLFKTKEQYPKAHKVIKIGLISILVFLILDKIIWYFDKDLAWLISDFIRVFFFLVILYPIFSLLKSKNKLAKYIVSGLLIVVICTIFNMVFRMTQAVDNPGYWDIPLVIQFVGIIISYIFFWLALGYNSQQIQIEKSTIQKNLEIEKQEKVFERKTNKLRNTFFTNITHEFRTPLTIINGLSAELKQSADKHIHQKQRISIETELKCYF